MKFWHTTLVLALGLTGCGDGGGGSSPTNPDTNPGGASVHGVVSQSGTGIRLSGVIVSSGGRSVQTDANGEYTLEVAADQDVVVDFSADGHAPGFERTLVAAGKEDAMMVSLKSQGSLQPYTRTTAQTLVQATEAGPYAVIFQADTLDTSDTDLRVAVTPLDPTKEATALPGELTSGESMLRPLTFAEFSIYDSIGRHVNLKPGSEAVVELPIPPTLRSRPEYQAGQTVHCYSFNPSTGQWEDFVVGTVTASSVDGVTPVVRATVKHFSWYGAAPQSDDCEWVVGRVVSAVDGNPLPDARVEAFPGTSTRTNANGEFTLITARGSNPSIVATRTYIDSDGSVSGTPGAKVIDFGKLDTDFDLLYPLISCQDAMAGTISPPSMIGLTATDARNVTVTIGRMELLSYNVTGWLTDTDAVVVLSDLLPDGTTGDPSSNAIVTLIGPDGTAYPMPETVLADTRTGLYTVNLAVLPGDRYTLTVDADANGTIDGSGSLSAIGNIAWSNPIDGSDLSRFELTADWSDTAVGTAGYSPVYWAAFNSNDLNNDTFAYYMGTERSFLVKDTATKSDLPAGSYTATLYGFSGAFQASAEYPVVNNITGSTVNGQFFSMRETTVNLTLH